MAVYQNSFYYMGFFKLFLVKLSELNPMDVNFTRKSKIYGKKKCFDLLWIEIVKLLFFPSEKTKLFIRDNCIFFKWSNH
jgi:hypothetical protein